MKTIIMSVIRNNSGVDSGELDYSINCAEFDKLDTKDVLRTIRMLTRLKNKCMDKMGEKK